VLPGDWSAALDELLARRDPWSSIDSIAREAGDAIVSSCEARLEAASPEGRRRLVALLERVRSAAAHAALLRRLPASSGDEAAQILRVLNSASVIVPSAEIDRRFADAWEEATVAAGISGDTSFAPRLAAMLEKPGLGRHAALALAQLGSREYSRAIAARIASADPLDAAGFVVALETMNDPSIVPELVALLSRGDVRCAWDLHHAVVHLTGREPLVRDAKDRHDTPVAYAEAWRAFSLDAVARPRLERVHVERASSSATFDLMDARGAIRLECDPPTPGSAWPRWFLSITASGRPLYAIGSRCGTCETTLRRTGASPSTAAQVAASVRSAVAHVDALDEQLLGALEGFVTMLRTGHYVARLVDLDLERVDEAERSWLTRRRALRRSDDFPDGDDDGTIEWPGDAHFQAREAAAGPFPTFGVLVPSSRLSDIRADTVDAWSAAIASGARPAALVMAWVEQKEVRAEFTERFLVGLVLDGHHKLAAYARAGRPARVLAICRVEDSWGPPDDRAGWIHEAIDALRARA
jgi:hypothetical protein